MTCPKMAVELWQGGELHEGEDVGECPAGAYNPKKSALRKQFMRSHYVPSIVVGADRKLN